MSDFWSVIWVVVWSFLFIAYLIVMFQIIGDLFRDRDLAGGWKAIWILALIFAPFLTALVYVIARGKGMAERQMGAAMQAKNQTDAYIQQVAGSRSPADQIGQAKSLLDSGTISRSEFEQLKSKALV